MKVVVNKMGINGEGIAYDRKVPIFIPRVLSGEEANIEIIEDLDTYKKGKLISVYKKSKSRIEPKCNYQHVCDGCQLMHTMVKNQLVIKKDILTETLYKYSKINKSLVSDVVASPKYFGYRNQFKFPIKSLNGKLESGMYKEGSTHLVTIPKCIIHEKRLEEIRIEVLKILNKYRVKDFYKKVNSGLRYVVLRGFNDNYQLTLVTGKNKLDKNCILEISKIKGIKSIYQNTNTLDNHIIMTNDFELLYGDKTIETKINEYKFNLSPNAFFQLNIEQATNIYNYVIDQIEPCNLVVEAYSGIGAMSILAAKKAKRVKGVEYIKNAVINANNNALINNVADKVEFVCDDAGSYLKKVKEEIDYLIIDPPRSGLDQKMLASIRKSLPKNIIYISCNPSTLAKNLNVLNNDYQIKKILPFDMFPNTPHVESVVLMSRDEK